MAGEEALEIEGYEVEERAKQIRLRVKSKERGVRCPLCGSESRRVHSHYERRLRDLPMGEYAVDLSWRVRKYVCERESCPRKIDAERLPEVAGYKARRTKRLEKSLVQMVWNNIGEFRSGASDRAAGGSRSRNAVPLAGGASGD